MIFVLLTVSAKSLESQTHAFEEMPEEPDNTVFIEVTLL